MNERLPAIVLSGSLGAGMSELNTGGFADHVPETEKYGAARFVGRPRRTADPLAIDNVLWRDWDRLIRAKRPFWLSTRTASVGKSNLAGSISRTEHKGHWSAAVGRKLSPEDADRTTGIRSLLASGWGKGCQDIVFVGSNNPTSLDPVLHHGAPEPLTAWRAAHAA